ncbi:hypothetical protein QBC41DRAFT_387507 [Cercophora samala]|uniref:Uncharacterized protein n=1 Tax=Cercophora samala TaxID=330535 RepID=A0AA39ZGX3_9PEZI|nr:hypothetical protein QBC41DRAFT_387507 [Cercophora samala]
MASTSQPTKRKRSNSDDGGKVTVKSEVRVKRESSEATAAPLPSYEYTQLRSMAGKISGPRVRKLLAQATQRHPDVLEELEREVADPVSKLLTFDRAAGSVKNILKPWALIDYGTWLIGNMINYGVVRDVTETSSFETKRGAIYTLTTILSHIINARGGLAKEIHTTHFCGSWGLSILGILKLCTAQELGYLGCWESRLDEVVNDARRRLVFFHDLQATRAYFRSKVGDGGQNKVNALPLAKEKPLLVKEEKPPVVKKEEYLLVKKEEKKEVVKEEEKKEGVKEEVKEEEKGEVKKVKVEHTE